MHYITQLLYSQFLITLPYPTPTTHSFTSQTIIITGSNTGLGLEAARHFTRLNAAKVILAVRDAIKGAAAAKAIIASTGCSENRIEVWPLDLSSFASIKAFALRVLQLERLDVVVQNAGLCKLTFEKTKEGHEMSLMVNVLGPALLTLMVLPKMQETAKELGTSGRMTFNGSGQQMLAKVKEQHDDGSLLAALSREPDMRDRYATTKLLLLHFVRHISSQIPPSSLIITYTTPGVAHSSIMREASTSTSLSFLERTIAPLFLNLVARTTEHGSRALVDAVRANVPPIWHGGCLRDCGLVDPGPNINSPQGTALSTRFITELLPYLESVIT